MELKREGIWIVNFTKEFWHSKNISLAAKGVYAVLKSFTNYNKSEAFPSLEYLSALTGLNERTIRRHIAELKEKKYLEVKRIRDKGKFGHNLYIIKETEAEKIKYINHRTKTNYGKNEKKTTGLKTTDGKYPTKINIHIKELGTANVLVFLLIESINKESNVYSIVNKFKVALGEDKLREILAGLVMRNKSFDDENKLAAYLQTCIKQNGKVTDNLREITKGEPGWL